MDLALKLPPVSVISSGIMQGLGFRDRGSGFRDSAFGCRVLGFRHGVSGLQGKVYKDIYIYIYIIERDREREREREGEFRDWGVRFNVYGSALLVQEWKINGTGNKKIQRNWGA